MRLSLATMEGPSLTPLGGGTRATRPVPPGLAVVRGARHGAPKRPSSVVFFFSYLILGNRIHGPVTARYLSPV